LLIAGKVCNKLPAKEGQLKVCNGASRPTAAKKLARLPARLFTACNIYAKLPEKAVGYGCQQYAKVNVPRDFHKSDSAVILNDI
jgi:hypothetical protein